MRRGKIMMGEICGFYGLLMCCLYAICGGARAEETFLLNEDYERTTRAGTNSVAPVGWMWFGGWGKEKTIDKTSGVYAGTASSGQRSLRFTVPAEGVKEGWFSQPLVRPENGEGLRVEYSAAADAKMQGLVLHTFITWYDKDGKYIEAARGEILWDIKPGLGFGRHCVEITPKQIPVNAATFKINTAIFRNDTCKEFSGCVYLDDLAVTLYEPPLAMVATKFASWWAFGETVVYRPELPESVPANLRTLTGVVFDSAGIRQTEVTVGRADLLKGGWIWMPQKPGLYEIEFFWNDETTKTIPVRRHYITQPRERKAVPVGDPLKIIRERYTLAVTRKAPRPIAERSLQFGACEHMNSIKTRIELADLLGLSWIRLCWVDWQYIEPEKGKYNWEYLDSAVRVMKQHGFKMVGTIYGTPRWASSHPNETEHFVTPRYSAYAPSNIRDWEEFIAALVDRYDDYIKEWNIWNEPFSPNGSVYWYDTAENYAKLLKSAYRVIKQKDPEATVSFAGGAAPDVYRVALREGVHGHYDAIAPHGTWPEPDTIRNVEKMMGFPPTQRWTNLEWHAILRRYDGNALDKTDGDEVSLSRRVLFDLANQIRSGVEKIGIFETLNLVEIEELQFDRTLNHASGFFRCKPVIEPRLPGLVLYTVVSQVKDRLTYYGEYALADQQKMVAFMTGGEPLLMFWSDAAEAAKPSSSLKAILQKAGSIIDWEGRSCGADDMLAPKIIRLASGGMMQELASLAKGSKIIISPRHQRPATPADVKVPNGYYVNGSLFDQPSGKLIESNLLWNTASWKWHGVGAEQPNDCTSRFALGMTQEAMDLVVEVKDNTHQPYMLQGRYYEGDSVQFGFDTEFLGPQPQSEFQVAGDGKENVVWKTLNGYSGGDLPDNYTPLGKVLNAEAYVEREKGVTVYRIRVKMGELYPFSFAPGKELRMSILVNNNDGQGRIGYAAWSDGIGDSKNAALYGRLMLRDKVDRQ